MTAPAIAAPACPKCQGPVWDQKSSKFWGNGLTKNGKQKPRWECKNKECGGAMWDKETTIHAEIQKPNPAKAPIPSHSNVPNKDLPPLLQNAEAEDNAELAAKVGVDLTKFSKDLALYTALTEFVTQKIAPLYGTEIGMSPESAVAAVATLYIQAHR